MERAFAFALTATILFSLNISLVPFCRRSAAFRGKYENNDDREKKTTPNKSRGNRVCFHTGLPTFSRDFAKEYIIVKFDDCDVSFARSPGVFPVFADPFISRFPRERGRTNRTIFRRIDRRTDGMDTRVHASYYNMRNVRLFFYRRKKPNYRWTFFFSLFKSMYIHLYVYIIVYRALGFKWF